MRRTQLCMLRMLLSMHRNLTQYRFPQSKSNLTAAPVATTEEATTPSDITAPSPSTSETSTVFTDVDGDEELRSAQPDEERAIDIEPSSATSTKSAVGNLKVYNASTHYALLQAHTLPD